MDVLKKLRESFARLSPKQRVQLALALVAALGLVWGFTTYVSHVRYGVLFSNLESSDAAPVLAALKEKQVDYRLAAGGTIVEVPVERIDELRLELAGEGLPSGGGVGFELFDKPAFGMSDFVQNVNYRRALERELARTIQSLDVVDSARVHLALPPESVFADEVRKPSASVVLKLRSGRTLAAGRVRAVAHLVASGVDGMEPGSVSVIDGEGRMLSGGSDHDDPTLSASQLEARRGMEQSIESTLISILEPVVGVGRARARATVELNMTRVQRVQETYDPDGAVVRSEEKIKSRNEASGGGGGIPGTASNLPGENGLSAGGSGETQQSQSSRTNFEINKTVSTISEPVGTLARQSIAVVVDHALVETTGENDEVTLTPTPRSDEEMAKITDLVRAAVGLDEGRGDQLIVQNVAFDDRGTPETDSGSGLVWELLDKSLRYLSLPLAVLLLALLVFRPAIGAFRSLRAEPTADGTPPTVAELQARLAGGELAVAGSGAPMRQKLIEAVRDDPQAAALVLRSWMNRSDEGDG